MEQTTDAGAHWVTDTGGVTGPALNAISCPDSEHCVAVGAAQAVLVTTNGGMNWSTSMGSSPQRSFTSVSCPDLEHCWATADAGSGFGTVEVTVNGGTSWTDLAWSPPLSYNAHDRFGSDLRNIVCTSTTDCVVVGDATYIQYPPPETTDPVSMISPGVVSTTSNGGVTWETQLFGNEFPRALACPSAHDCLAVGQDSAYRIASPDSGATWTVSVATTGSYINKSGASDPSDLDAISCTDTLHCFAVGQYFTATNHVAYETPVIATSDGGATWISQATHPNDANLLAVACVSPLDCWVVGSTINPSNDATIGALIDRTINGGEASPTVSGVSPSDGSTGGGTQVSVMGTGFKFGVTSVQFGSVAATNVTVISDSEVTVTTPPSSVGVVPPSGTAVDVTVTTPLGTSPLNAHDQFTYGTTLALTSSSPGASCNNTNPGSPVCIGMASGTVLTVSGTGLRPGALAWSAQCSSDPGQPVVLFLGQYIPVSCSRLALTIIPSSGPNKGDFSGAHTLGSGTIGPPGVGLTPTCTEGSTPIPGCTTSGNAEIDTASYPCPPTVAQQAAGDTCVIAIGDAAQDHAFGILLFSNE